MRANMKQSLEKLLLRSQVEKGLGEGFLGFGFCGLNSDWSQIERINAYVFRQPATARELPKKWNGFCFGLGMTPDLPWWRTSQNIKNWRVQARDSSSVRRIATSRAAAATLLFEYQTYRDPHEYMHQSKQVNNEWRNSLRYIFKRDRIRNHRQDSSRCTIETSNQRLAFSIKDWPSQHSNRVVKQSSQKRENLPDQSQ